MSFEIEILQAQYEAAIFSLAHGVETDVMLESMKMLADNDLLEEAEGIRLAVIDFEYNKGKQNCSVKPVILQEEEDWGGYVDEGYEGIEDEDDEDE